MDEEVKEVPAAEFKQRCLSIIDEVARTQRVVVITKRGKPLVRLMALETDLEIEERILSVLRSGEGGMLVDEDAFLAPTADQTLRIVSSPPPRWIATPRC